jgi:hypothetical protein
MFGKEKKFLKGLAGKHTGRRPLGILKHRQSKVLSYKI